MSESKQSLPPLPELEIHGMAKLCGLDQQTVDDVLRKVYENRPDLFAEFMERERKIETGVLQEDAPDDFPERFVAYVGGDLKIGGSLVTPNILFEARRRTRLMLGLDI